MNNKSLKNKILIILLCTSIVVGAFFGGFFCAFFSYNKEIRQLNSVLRLIEKESIFIDDGLGEIKDGEIIDAVVSTILKQDRYAEYYTKEEFETLKSTNKGEYKGIGLTLVSGSNVLYNVIGNSPAQKAGLIKGDIFISASIKGETEFTTFSNEYTVLDFLNDNEEQTSFSFKITREGEFTERIFDLSRQEYNASFVFYYDNNNAFAFAKDDSKKITKNEIPRQSEYNVVDNESAIIKLLSFSVGADEQFKSAVNYFKQSGKTKLILDLRSNGGGNMEVLEEICSFLIFNGGQKKSVVTYIHKKDEGPEVRSTSKNNFMDYDDIVVLADFGSASATEALIGAMLYYGNEQRDNNFSYDNLIIVGDNEKASTFGKGIMQTTYSLLGGTAIKLTTAKIYWPDNQTCIHEKGISTIPQNVVQDNHAISRAFSILA